MAIRRCSRRWPGEKAEVGPDADATLRADFVESCGVNLPGNLPRRTVRGESDDAR